MKLDAIVVVGSVFRARGNTGAVSVYLGSSRVSEVNPEALVVWHGGTGDYDP